MVKLSAQLRSRIPEREVRQTRTERIIEKRRSDIELGKQQQEQKQETLKQQAQDIQEEKISKITSQQEYQNVYEKLSPEHKQFFDTPETFYQKNKPFFEQQAAKREASEWKEAQRWVLLGKPEFAADPSLRRKMRELKERGLTTAEHQYKLKKELGELAQEGLIAEYGTIKTPQGEVKDTIVGFRDVEAGKSVGIKQLPKYREEKKIEQARLKTPEILMPIEYKEVAAPSVVERGTISTQPKKETVFIPRFTEEDKPKHPELKTDLKYIWTATKETTGLKYISTHLKEIYDKIPEVPLYLTKYGHIQPYKLRKEDKSLEELKQAGLQKIDEALLILKLEQQERAGVKTIIEPQFQEEMQERFEQKYLKRIEAGEVEFKDVEKEFLESKDVELLQKKYEEEIQKAEAGLGLTGTGFKIAGLQIGRTVTSIAPTSVKEAAIVTAAAYGGYKALMLIPPKVIPVIEAGFFAKGVKDIVSPLSLPEQRAGGFITAAISGGFLTYRAVRYLRSPVIKTEALIPKATLTKAEQQALRSPLLKREIVKDIYGKTKITDYYKVQRVTETISEGRKTIVTTKIREYLGLKPIYKGSPYQDLGKIYSFKGLRTDFVWKTESAYQKALNKLINYKLTEAQARQTLRLYRPKIIYTAADVDAKLIYGTQFKTPIIKSYTERVVYQPQRTIADIKTLTKTPYTELIKGEGKILGETKAGNVLTEVTFNIEKMGLTSEGYLINYLKEAGKTSRVVRQVSSSEVIGSGKFNLLGKETPYTKYLEATLEKQVLPSKTYTFGKSDLFALERTTDVPVSVYDESKLTGVRIRPDVTPSVKKITTTISDYSKTDLQKLTKTLKDIYGTPTKTFPTMPTTPIKTITKQVTDLSTTQIPALDIAKTNLKSLIKNIGKMGEAAIVKSTQAAALLPALQVRSKQDTALKSQLKSRLGLNEREALKVKQMQRQLDKQMLRQLQPTALLQIQMQPLIASPTMRTPPTTTPRVPKFPPMITPFFTFNEDKLLKKLKQQKTKGIYGQAYMPSFTARALQLQPIEVTEKQALKLIKKVQTGFDLRLPAIVRNN